jgi:hypothetical protein
MYSSAEGRGGAVANYGEIQSLSGTFAYNSVNSKSNTNNGGGSTNINIKTKTGGGSKHSESKWNKMMAGNDFAYSKRNSLKETQIKPLITDVWLPMNVNGEIKWVKKQFNKNLHTELVNVFSLITFGRTLTEKEIEDKKVDIPFANNEYLINGKQFEMNPNWCHTYLYRKKRKGNTLSTHSFGCAIDINAPENPMISNTANENYTKLEDTVTRIRTWAHPVVKAFLSQGFGWGIYKNDYDYMHFSYLTNEGYNKKKDDTTKPPADKNQSFLVGT